jgi:hypothetical protein
MTTNLNLYKVNTSAHNEEDFLILTSLTDKEIKETLEPIVLIERQVTNGDVMFNNEDYIHLLQKEYPQAIVIHYTIDGIETISI